MKRPPVSRRDFLRTTSAATAGLLILRPRAAGALAANDRLAVAGVGTGGKGWSDLLGAEAAGAQIVAVADVDAKGAGGRRGGYEAALDRFPDARGYADWRKLLEKEADKLDGILVSTPDHMHAPVTMTALKLGLACYTQKPLTRTVEEARRLTEAARAAGVATQMGNQHHNGSGYRNAVQLIQVGAVGKIREAHAWSDRPIWPQGTARPDGKDAVPESLDWDLWLGVAPERPYKNEIYHPFRWRGWYDFGAGALGDMGCHILDPVVWALALPGPTSVRYEGPEPAKETFPEWELIHYEFPGTQYTDGGTVRVTWHDGGRKPSPEAVGLPGDTKLPDNGALFVGTKGALLAQHGGAPELLPEKDFADLELPKLETINHYTQWLDAIRGTGSTTSGFDYAGPLTETVLLGTVACRVPQETLYWDSKAGRFTGNTAANELLHQEYRRGWEVDGL